MSVLKVNFNKKDYNSPTMDDLERKVRIDEDGNEFITYEKVDYKTFEKERGLVDVWKLDKMLAAGISPTISSIHTGNNTRLEGSNTVADAIATLDIILDEENKEEKE